MRLAEAGKPAALQTAKPPVCLELPLCPGCDPVASCFSQVTAATPSFEEVALRLVDVGEPAALQTFLLTKLHTLGPTDKAQVQIFPALL